MRLPSKIISYSSSSLSKFSLILSLLESADQTPGELYYKVRKSFDSISEFYEALDGLYALGVIELIMPKGVLHYVGRDLL